MELRQLRYFMAVAEHRNFSRAAEAIFVSQPALSQQIRGLERELGHPLFDRLGRHVELTAAGRLLREYAERILREVDNARSALADLKGALRGDLAIAAVQTANAGFLMDVIARFHATHPGVVVRVWEDRADGVVQAVRDGRAGLGVTYLPAPAEPELEAVPLYTEELELVVPEDHELAGGVVSVARLADLPLVAPPEGYCLRRGIEIACAEAGVRPRIVAEITAVESICDAVRSGLGVAVLPARYIRPRAAQGRLAVASLAGPVPRRTIVVLRHRERHACHATRAFLGSLEAAAKDEVRVAAA